MVRCIDLVTAFYDALRRGQQHEALALLHPEIEWTTMEGFPYFSGTWHGPNAVHDRLLRPIDRDWHGFSAMPLDFLCEGNRVVALGVYSGLARATGLTMRAPFAHVWWSRDNLLAHHDMYTDTLMINAALMPTSDME